ncbi:MAG: hypothetical protein JWO42_847, partial [Chloroflexi bacterium]|nr:hypothetical protein [Chloroflexota bacterium]
HGGESIDHETISSMPRSYPRVSVGRWSVLSVYRSGYGPFVRFPNEPRAAIKLRLSIA